jgi:hypothetical protein
MRREGRLDVVAVLHRYRPLHHDRPAVEPLVDQVDGAAADLHPVLEGLALRVDARGRRAAGWGGR